MRPNGCDGAHAGACAAGVSRNSYSQFNVAPQGAILNNSRTNVQTQLGGWAQGNPWLAGGSAKVAIVSLLAPMACTEPPVPAERLSTQAIVPAPPGVSQMRVMHATVRAAAVSWRCCPRRRPT